MFHTGCSGMIVEIIPPKSMGVKDLLSDTLAKENITWLRGNN